MTDIDPAFPPSKEWLALAYSHLTRGKSSAFISLCTSICQVLNYAFTITNPKEAEIFIIDLSHKDLMAPNTMFRAQDVIQLFKFKNMKWVYSYQGLNEILGQYR